MNLVLDTQQKAMTNALFKASLIVVAFVLAVIAFGDASAGSMPWDGALTKLKNNLSGPVAGGIALLALVGAGAALVFSEDISGFIRKMLYLVLAIAVLVLANTLLSNLGLTAGGGGLVLPDYIVIEGV